MESHNGLGRELLWGLLACQNLLVQRRALTEAVGAWIASGATPLEHCMRERFGLNPDQLARLDGLTDDYLQAKDSSPLRFLQTVALQEVLDRLLEQVADHQVRSILQNAALAVGINAPAPGSLSMGVGPADRKRPVMAGAAKGNGQAEAPVVDASEELDSPDTRDSGTDQSTLSSTENDPAADPPAHDPEATSAWSADQTEALWPPPPSDEDQRGGRSQTDGSTTRYRIIRPHAEGGLGAVFVAHDQELHREVALKEILEKHVHITENRLRFLLEAEVTGGLEHPGIVPVHGLGHYDDGRPYYAMRFIRGTSLKSALAVFHAADGPKRDPSERALALRRLLTHFVDVCEAIAYAHSRGVLHRDLKPANIMLGKFGETLVVDWGLAKPLLRCFPQNEDHPPAASRTVLDPAEEQTQLVSGEQAFPRPRSGSSTSENAPPQEQPLIPPSLGKSTETLAGTRVGTPAFMSPEQAAGQIDQLGPPSDIYSLGATLYNILTGKPPFIGSDLSKVLTRVSQGDFPPPRQVNASVPCPLEAIVLRAMALKPESRYASPKALRDDIEHWMADEAVSAYRDPLPARLARWARRHKTLVATSAALLLAAVVGLTTGSVLLERERARTDRERVLAVKNYGYAYEAAETMLSRVGDVDLADIPQMEPVRRELLETAKFQFHKLLEQQSNDPQVLLLEGRTRARLGDVLEMMGQYNEAEQNYREAIHSLEDLERRLPGDDGPIRARARAEHGLGILLRKLNRFSDAEKCLREAIQLRDQLAARSPTDHALLQARSDSRYHLGALLARLASPTAEDRKLYEQAILDQEALLNLQPDEPENRIKLARYLNNLAILEAKSDPAKAETSLREALRLLAGLDTSRAGLPDARWQEARASNNLSRFVDRKEGKKQAHAILTRARDILSRLAAEFPRILQYRRELASVFNNLGRFGRNTQDEKLALESFQRSAEQLQKLAQESPQVPDYRENRDIALFQLGLLKVETDPAAAERELSSLLADQEKLIASYPNVPDYRNASGRNLLEYGKLLLQNGDSTRASPLLEKAATRFEEALKDDPGNRTYGQNLSEALTFQIQIAIKAKQVQQIAALAERLIEPPTADLTAYLTAAVGLTRCLVMTSTNESLAPEIRDQQAEAYGRGAVEILQKAVERKLLHSSDPLIYQEFVPLRTRPDFIELFKKLQTLQVPVTG